MLGGLERALLGALLLVLMAGMGATLTPAVFAQVLRRPRGVLIGLASQFGWMPLLAYGLAAVLELPGDLALGLLIVGCTPGGTTSNMFTYYSRADLGLSISMTVASTIAAVVMMPALLWLYVGRMAGTALAVPYGNIVTTLALVLVPVGLGMWLRARRPAAAVRLEAIGSASGVAVLALLVGTSLWRNWADLGAVPAVGYLAAVSLGVLGMGLGYLAARQLGLDVPARRAVSLETGIQNSPLAFAIVLASFPESSQTRILWLPLVYALFVLISASVVTLRFRATPFAASDTPDTPVRPAAA